jgi:lipoprotein NlpD
VSLTRAIAVAVLCCVLEGGCASDGAYGPATYVVRPEDTLYSIAWRHNLDFRELAKWNDIGTDYRLSIGQVLVLEPGGRPGVPGHAASAPAPAPAPARAPASVSSAPRPREVPRARDVPRVGKPTPLGDASPGGALNGSAPAGSAPAKPPSAAAAAPAANARLGESEPIAPAVAPGGSKWVWPTDRVSPPRPVPGGGVLLLGRLGQDVRAANSGRVVYTGSGLRGYGNLIIIKHGDNLLSSYAHNRELLVHEGQEVAAGQLIAHMGMGPHQISALYFEIRVNGKPTDPLRYLTSAR